MVVETILASGIGAALVSWIPATINRIRSKREHKQTLEIIHTRYCYETYYRKLKAGETVCLKTGQCSLLIELSKQDIETKCSLQNVKKELDLK